MGQPYASNIGMKLCKTKYIWFFDDDDFVKKTDVIKIIYYLKIKNVGLNKTRTGFFKLIFKSSPLHSFVKSFSVYT